MASSSSDFSNSSTESKTSQEMTLEFDSKDAYEASAPLHWDAEEWDFWAWSEDDESLTNDEDLQFLLDGELEDEDDDVSWEGHDSSEEEDDDESTEEDLTAGSFLRTRSSDEDDDGDDGGDSDDRDDGGDSDDGADSDDGSTSDDGARDDGSDGGSGDDDSDVGAVPPIKHRRFSGTYWW
jgi:hypothetical protein